MQLRKYQEEAKNAVLETWEIGTDKTLLVLPTGTGKTIVFSKIVEDRVRNGHRVLILAHREELLNQASDKLFKATGLRTALEKAENSCRDSWLNVIVGSIQTLQNPKRLETFPEDYFDTIIVDEAHHAISASYRRVLDHFESAKVLGVTATADRGDKRSLGEYFESIAYEYTLVKAIKEGFLVPIKAKTVPLEINLNNVKISAGDFQASELGATLEPYLERIADEMVMHCSDKKTVVFLPLISTSQKFCEILNKKGLSATEVNGTSQDRTEIITDFETGKYKVLCNSMLLTEGWDCPSVDCIVCLRPTKVRALYAQIVGRGTRLHPGKDHLLLLDFLWNTDRHDLCRPASLVCDNADISMRVAEILAEETKGKAVDLLEGVDGAESEAAAEREESLRKVLEEQRKKKAKLVDVLQFEMSIDDKGKQYQPDPNNLKEQAPATAAQLAFIEKSGLNPDAVTCQGHASQLIDTIHKRRNANLATPKQIRCLERYNFKNVGMWSWTEANKMIGRIAGNAWHVPQIIDPQNYKPNQ
jgi:superfamily II DNA or RNA helicase